MTAVDNKNSRTAGADIESMFTNRWSSKAFSDQMLKQEQITSLFEAARWAPSGNNRQPWLFVYSTSGPQREKFDSLLSEGNAVYVPKAAMMVLVFARTVDDDGNRIRTAFFDTGAAWMSLALQANLMGLNTRALGGIDLDGAYEVANVPADKYETVCGIAVGYPGTDADLIPSLVEQNFANDRKDISLVAYSDSYSP